MPSYWGYYTSSSTAVDTTSSNWGSSITASTSTFIYYPPSVPSEWVVTPITPITYTYGITYDSIPETKEQMFTRLEAQKAYDLEQERLRKEREQAEAKAETLLKEHIGLEAFGKMHQVGHIEVDSQKYAGRKYWVPKGRRNLIEVIDERGKVIDRLCVHPTETYPVGDEILARIVMLKFAEEEMLKIANHNPVVV